VIERGARGETLALSATSRNVALPIPAEIDARLGLQRQPSQTAYLIAISTGGNCPHSMTPLARTGSDIDRRCGDGGRIIVALFYQSRICSLNERGRQLSRLPAH